MHFVKLKTLAKRSKLSFVILVKPLIESGMQVLFINKGQLVFRESYCIGLPTISSNADTELCYLVLNLNGPL